MLLKEVKHTKEKGACAIMVNDFIFGADQKYYARGFLSVKVHATFHTDKVSDWEVDIMEHYVL